MYVCMYVWNLFQSCDSIDSAMQTRYIERFMVQTQYIERCCVQSQCVKTFWKQALRLCPAVGYGHLCVRFRVIDVVIFSEPLGFATSSN